MKLPGTLGDLDFGQWAIGLAAAFIGGGAGAFSSGLASILVDPGDFNIYSPKFYKLVSTAFVISGLTPFFALLHQKPLPDVKRVVKTVETTETEKKAPVVVTTVQETSIERKDGEPEKPKP